MLQTDAYSVNGNNQVQSFWNPANFEGVVLKYQSALYNYIYSMVRDVELARDLVNDTFMLAYRNLTRYPRDLSEINISSGSFSAWLYTIARNKTIGELRRNKAGREYSLNNKVDFNDSYDGMDNSLENLLADPTMNLEDRALDHLELLQAIKQIEPKRLKPLKLLLEGFTYQEIAEQLGESLDTVRSRIFRVRQDLRRAIYQDRKAIPA